MPPSHPSACGGACGRYRRVRRQQRRAASEVGFTGIGVNQAGGEERFIHLDDIQPEDEFHVPRPWIWSYA